MTVFAAPMRVLLAPDKFKGSLSAAEVAAHLQAGLASPATGWTFDRCPIADGGEGTVDAAVTAGFRRVAVTVAGPTGQLIPAQYAEHDGTAVVELAQASGLALLPGGVTAPLTASSRGTGQLVRAALDRGCERVVLGVGGSATTDGGAGLLEGLGARFLDAQGHPVDQRGSELLPNVHTMDLSAMHPRIGEVEIVVACDVDNPLHGPEGAAFVYGPQKGADPAEVELLDRRLRRWAEVVRRHTGDDFAECPGSGAAGGVAFAAMSVLGARRRNGGDLILDVLRFPDRLRRADLVITGEGSLDEQTLRGKGPVRVARHCRAAGIPVIVVAGHNALTARQCEDAGFARAYSLLDWQPDVGLAHSQAGQLLTAVGARIRRDSTTSDW